MKTKTKKILSVLFAVLFSFLLYCYACCILLPKNSKDVGGKNYFMGRGFHGEPKKHSLDIIVFGNSNVYSGFSPNKLFEEYGYTSYASGVARQTVDRIDKILNEAMRSQKPKVAVLDVDCLYFKRDSGPDNYNFFFAPFTFHYRWKYLKAADFYTLPRKNKTYDIHKGYVFSAKKKPLSPGNFMGGKDAAPQAIGKKNLRYLRRFLRTCRENEIEPMFIQLPTNAPWSYARHNYIQSVAEEEEIPFYDLNCENADFKIDYSAEFRDDQHLNVYGAERTTVYLGKLFSERFGEKLRDKREDAEYSYWQQAVDFYEKQKAEAKE